jgi:hypothetical protein
LPEALAQQYHQ